jgi:hypothetical protein
MPRLTVTLAVEVDAVDGYTEADVLDHLTWALDTLAPAEAPLTSLDTSDLDLSAVRAVSVRQIATEPEVPVWGPREGKTGPVHRGLDGDAHYGQSWCGKRAQFRHRVTTALESSVTCTTCLRRLRLGSPLSYGAQR